MKLSIIIPIYNEINLIQTVLDNVRSINIDKELILVDDHSQDGTVDFLKKEENKPDTKVFYHSVNMGKGRAIRTGLEHFSGDIVIIQDADLEYDPLEIPKVIQPIIDGKTKAAYGSRFLGSVKGMRLANYTANKILAFLVTVLFNNKITDEATAYKAFTADLIRSIPLECRRFEFCPEVTAKVLRRGEKIIEVPVHFNARTFEEGKKIGWKDFFVAVYTLLKFRICKF